jgi:hypothetical protein
VNIGNNSGKSKSVIRGKISRIYNRVQSTIKIMFGETKLRAPRRRVWNVLKVIINN